MTQDSYGRYVASHRAYDHVGNILPEVECSEGQRPWGPFRPAPWLPVQFWEKHFEDWFTIMPGKIVACDNNDHIVPAQYGLSGATVTYTSNDVDAGVLDVRTGLPLLSSATGTFAVSGVSNFMGQNLSEALAVSSPIGVTFYAIWKWAGGEGTNPLEWTNHNYQAQPRISILCDGYLKLPVVPGATASEDLGGTTASNLAITFGTKGWHSRTGIIATDRFASTSTTAPVVAYAFDNYPVAKETLRTLITWYADTAGTTATTDEFVREVSSVSLISGSGDYFLDQDAGVIFVYSADGATLPGGFGSAEGSVSYYHYASVPSSVSKFACALGNLKGGDHVKCDLNSNFVVDSSPSVTSTMGQITSILSDYPYDFKDRTKSRYQSLNTNSAGALPGYAGQMDQMPGTANGGYPSSVHYSGAANRMALINLNTR